MRKWWRRYKVAVYLTEKEWLLINRLCGDVPMSRYIRETVLREVDNDPR